jgi:hypothetical protein
LSSYMLHCIVYFTKDLGYRRKQRAFDAEVPVSIVETRIMSTTLLFA